MPTTATRAARAVSYSDLYARWERGHWLATEVDFTQDRVDWHERLDAGQRRALLWLFSLFFHGEDEVADTLSPYLDAAPTEEQTYFLATQQVDEARHAVFFSRFIHEVVGLGDGSPGSGLDATAALLTPGHVATFRNLAAVGERLREDRSPLAFADAVTNYHIIVEGSLAQPGQHLLEDWLEGAGVLPGFLQGLRNVAIDEQRHIAFGMKVLSEHYAKAPEAVGEVIVNAIRAVGNATMGFAYPAGRGDILDPLGLRLQTVYAESTRALTTRLRGIGLSEDQRRRALTLDPSVSFERQGEMIVQLLEAGYIGDGSLPKSKEPADLGVLFSMMANVMAANGPAVGTLVQFDFSDVGPVHFVQTDEALSFHRDRHESPSVTVKIALDDLLELLAERLNPVRLLVSGRLRVRGDLGLLVGRRSVFGPPPKKATDRAPWWRRGATSSRSS